jgi:hypothetical protein
LTSIRRKTSAIWAFGDNPRRIPFLFEAELCAFCEALLSRHISTSLSNTLNSHKIVATGDASAGDDARLGCSRDFPQLRVSVRA